MTETTAPMHGEAESAPAHTEARRQDLPSCAACQQPFKARKGWQRFCSTKCRDSWHTWTKTVGEARELVRLALEGGVGDPGWQARAKKLLGVR